MKKTIKYLVIMYLLVSLIEWSLIPLYWSNDAKVYFITLSSIVVTVVYIIKIAVEIE